MRWRIAAGAMAAVLLVSACGGAGSTPTPSPVGSPESSPAPSEASPAPSPEPVTITYMTFSAAPDHLADLDAIVKAFEAQNPGIKIQVDAVAWNDYWTKLQTAVAAGSAPDTFELNYENFVDFAEKGTLRELDSLIAGDSSFDPGIYYEPAYKVFNQAGKQYGLVETFSTVVLFYNKDLFDAKGVPYPTADWKWADEVEAAKQLTDRAAGVWGTFAPIQFWEFYKVAAQNGGAIARDGQITINSPENVEALQYMIDKIVTHKVTPTDAEMGGLSDGDMFKAGKLAMLHTGIWMFAAFKDAPFSWDIALEPYNKQRANHFFANAVAISARSQHPKEAWEWIKFLTGSREAAEIRIQSGWELPAVTNPEYVQGYLSQSPPASRQVVFDALNNPVVPPKIGNWSEMTDAIGKELDAAKLGQQTPEQALANAAARLEALKQ